MIPDPGLHHGRAFKEYDSWPAVTRRDLTALRKSPAHYKWQALNKGREKVTDEMIFGQAVHSAILEPNKFDLEFFRAPQVNRTTKMGKAAWAEAQKEAAGRVMLKTNVFELVLQVRDSVYKAAWPIVSNKRKAVEMSCLWEDKATGLLCKARPDLYDPEAETLYDVKTTQSALPEAFSRSIYGLDYHRQAAWYMEALRALSRPVQHFVFIAVEKDPPFGVSFFRLSDEAIKFATDENALLLEKFRRCRDRNDWPGYSTAVHEIGLPSYATQTIESNLETLEEALENEPYEPESEQEQTQTGTST